MADVCYSWC